MINWPWVVLCSIPIPSLTSFSLVGHCSLLWGPYWKPQHHSRNKNTLHDYACHLKPGIPSAHNSNLIKLVDTSLCFSFLHFLCVQLFLWNWILLIFLPSHKPQVESLCPIISFPNHGLSLTIPLLTWPYPLRLKISLLSPFGSPSWWSWHFRCSGHIPVSLKIQSGKQQLH